MIEKFDPYIYLFKVIYIITNMKTRSMIANMKFMVLDIETDGIGTFRPGRQRPIQVSFLLCDYTGI